MEKKIIILLSYYFPPCNATASNRVGFWAENLNKEGIYPIIITRHWKQNIKENEDYFKTDNSKLKIEKYTNYEVHFLPYEMSFEEKLLVLYNLDTKIKLLFYYIILIFKNFLKIIGFKIQKFKPFFNYAKFIFDTKKSNTLLISASPFHLYEIGFELKKLNPELKWFADYRDDWSSNTTFIPENIFASFIVRLHLKTESYLEKKWVNTCSQIFTVSKGYAAKIKSLIRDKTVTTIYNGYDDIVASFRILNRKQEVFTIIYNGTLYPNQDIESFLKIFSKVVELREKPIKLIFIGAAADKESELRIRKASKGFECFIEVTNRMNRKEALRIQSEAHLALFVSSKTPGFIPSKIFEYIGLNLDTIIFGQGDSEAEEILLEAGKGFVFANDKKLLDFLVNYNVLDSKNEAEIGKIEKTSRMKQLKILAKILNEE